jgi:hypothetical protein
MDYQVQVHKDKWDDHEAAAFKLYCKLRKQWLAACRLRKQRNAEFIAAIQENTRERIGR